MADVVDLDNLPPLGAAALLRARFPSTWSTLSDLTSYPAYLFADFATLFPRIDRPKLETLLSKLLTCQKRYAHSYHFTRLC